MITQARASELRLSVRRMCQVLGVNRSCYYARQRPRNAAQPPAEQQAICQALLQLAKVFPRYGDRRMNAALRRQGYRINHKRGMRLMHALQLVQPDRKRRVVRTTQSDHGLRIYPNLIREGLGSRLTQMWVADLR